MIWKNEAGEAFNGIAEAIDSICRKTKPCSGCPLNTLKFCGEPNNEAVEALGLEVDHLKHNEHVACVTATVVVDDKGNVTGWWDNNGQTMLIHAATDTNVGDKEVEA